MIERPTDPGGEPDTAAANVVSWERGRLRQTLPRLVARCMSFSAKTAFDPSLAAAVFRFYGLEVDVATAESEILSDEDERVRFFPWFLWDWRSDEGAATVGERFLAEADLSPLEARLTDALCRSHIGFHEIVERSEQRVVVVDQVTGQRLVIHDEALAADVRQGQIVQARFVLSGEAAPEQVALVDAVYAVLSGDACAAVRREVGSFIGDTAEPEPLLKAYAPELLEVTDHIIDTMTRPPVARNAEGDPLVLTRTRLSRADAARLTAALDEGLEGFEAAEEGLWLWHDARGRTGFVDARDPDRAAVAANTPRRHDALWAALAPAVGLGARGLSSLEDFSHAVQRWADSGGGEPWIDVDADVRAGVREWLSAWARRWADMPLGALSDRTPREAVSDSRGRRRVDQMLGHFEELMLGKLDTGSSSCLSLDSLRSELGLS